MTLSGDAILKLLGMDAQTAATYHFRSTVLKQKKLSPDIEGWSLVSSDQPRAMLEFLPTPWMTFLHRDSACGVGTL